MTEKSTRLFIGRAYVTIIVLWFFAAPVLFLIGALAIDQWTWLRQWTWLGIGSYLVGLLCWYGSAYWIYDKLFTLA